MTAYFPAVRSVLLLVLAGFSGMLNPVCAKERIRMPWPVQYIGLELEGRTFRMAYLDVPAATNTGKTVVLLHGKNFNGYYWRETVLWMSRQGYRVIVPDQLGFGNSDMADIHYSFHQLASNTRALLDSLGIGRLTVIGHSMGGMLATRFALMYPDRVDKLVLEDPIGLEDYRRMVPFTPIDAQLKTELAATYESYLKYQKSYYPVWKPQYDTLVRIQALALADPDFKAVAKASALTYGMIYQQPVCYEFDRLRVPTLLIVGAEDRTVVGKALIPGRDRGRYGNYPELGKLTRATIPDARLVMLPGIGHIPHMEDFPSFRSAVASFLGVNTR